MMTTDITNQTHIKPLEPHRLTYIFIITHQMYLDQLTTGLKTVFFQKSLTEKITFLFRIQISLTKIRL